MLAAYYLQVIVSGQLNVDASGTNTAAESPFTLASSASVEPAIDFLAKFAADGTLTWCVCRVDLLLISASCLIYNLLSVRAVCLSVSAFEFGHGLHVSFDVLYVSRPFLCSFPQQHKCACCYRRLRKIDMPMVAALL